MPVPLSVMQSAAQGDRKAMRLIEQEYGVGNGQNYAIDWLSEEEPPPRVPTGVKGIEHPTRREAIWEYPEEGRAQAREGEAKALAEKLSRLKKKSDIQDVLLKVAAEDTELAEETARMIMMGGMALTTAALTANPIVSEALALKQPIEAAVLGGMTGGTGSMVGGLGGAYGSLAVRDYEKKEWDARKRMKSIELSPEAQTIYDEYKAKGYSPTYYKTK